MVVLALAVTLAAGSPALEVRSDGHRLPLVELYTSEGCSSCPPVDRALAALAAAAVPLSFHVTYWDHIGWRDRFAAREFDARQETYGRRAGWPTIYTPQVLVDGVDARERGALLLDRLARIGREPARVDLELRAEWLEGGSALAIRASAAPRAPAEESLRLHVAVFERGLQSVVRAGENGGRTLQHDYVVRAFPRPAECPPGGAPCRLETRVKLPAAWQRPALGVAVFAQGERSLAVYQAAAGMLLAAR